MSGRTYLSIGDVLALLRQEFPDVTISKIRFLESQGLVDPERTPSGYRKFYDHDVERLRWVLRQQREHFLPLKVIKGRLEQEVTGDGNGCGADPVGTERGPAERTAPVLVGRAAGARSLASAPASTSAPTPASTPASAATPASAPTPAGTAASATTTTAPPASGGAARGVPAGAGATGTAGASVAAPPTTGARASVSHDASGGARAGSPRPAAPGRVAGAKGLAGAGAGGGGPAGAAPGPSPTPPARGATGAAPAGVGEAAVPTLSGSSMTVDELAQASGMDVPAVQQLESFGLVSGRVVGGVVYYEEDALAVARLAAGFARYGVEARHLRLHKHAAEREAGFIEQIVLPLLKQRNPEARHRAHDAVAELSRLGQGLREVLLRTTLRDQLGG
ncbi:MAG TPA: MerR family transcriptional regulator [Acidimicrobiales bacterium]|nr:MerR family transcriptional regulator [Acidimicrobiales bacterium]